MKTWPVRLTADEMSDIALALSYRVNSPTLTYEDKVRLHRIHVMIVDSMIAMKRHDEDVGRKSM